MIKKAMLAGGGRATRLQPVTATTNKHLLPLANKAMIFHAIEKVVEAGIEEIFINVNPGEEELQKYVGDGGHWGVKIKFFEQTGGPQGIAHVVNIAKDFIGDDSFMFYLSDNILFGGVKEMVDEFAKNNYDCMLALSKVPDPNRFGVPKFDADGNLVDVIEKPDDPPSDFAVTGIYLYGPKVFFEAFQNIIKSARGEYEISSIHSYFLKNNKKVGYKEITGWWKDTGQVGDLLLANNLLLEKMGTGVNVSPSSAVGDKVELIAPVMIGENCILENCKIGPNVTIGPGSVIKKAKIENSILLSGVEIDCPITLADSLIGKNVKFTKKEGGDQKHRLIVGDKTVIEY